MGKKSAVTGVNEILTSTNTTLRNAEHIANQLNVHLTLIGPRLATNLPVSTTNAEDYLKRKPSSFEFAKIESSRVLKLLSKTDVTKATGLDQISNRVFKLAAPVILQTINWNYLTFLEAGKSSPCVSVKQVNAMIQITTDHDQSYQLYPEFLKASL